MLWYQRDFKSRTSASFYSDADDPLSATRQIPASSSNTWIPSVCASLSLPTTTAACRAATSHMRPPATRAAPPNTLAGTCSLNLHCRLFDAFAYYCLLQDASHPTSCALSPASTTRKFIFCRCVSICDFGLVNPLQGRLSRGSSSRRH